MKIILLSFLILVNSYSIDFNILPIKLNPINVKVTFWLPQSVNGAIEIKIHYQTNTNLTTNEIIKYYETYLDFEWRICENKVTKYNKWLLDVKTINMN